MGVTTDSFQIPNKQELNKLVKNVDYKKISIDEVHNKVVLPKETEIDLGGVGKGYTSEEISKMLKELGVKSAAINLGGNVQVLGSKPDGKAWHIGIRDPKSDDKMSCVINVVDKAAVTSGGYERYFEFPQNK